MNKEQIQKRANKKRAENARRRTGEIICQKLNNLEIDYTILSENQRQSQLSNCSDWHQNTNNGKYQETIIDTGEKLEQWLSENFPIQQDSQPIISILDYDRSPLIRLNLISWLNIGKYIVLSLRSIQIYDSSSGKIASIELNEKTKFIVEIGMSGLGCFPDDN